MNTMIINEQQAIIAYDEDIDMFRGEFVNLNGGADFYAKTIDGLRREGETSLRAFLDMCNEDGAEPYRKWSGKFNVRLNPQTHAALVTAAKSRGKSLNMFVAEALEQAVHHG